jgi:elongation factor P hydroxylase
MNQHSYLSRIVQSRVDQFPVGGVIQLCVNDECVGTIYTKAFASPLMTPDEAAIEAQYFFNSNIENDSHEEIIEKLLNFIGYFETVGRDRLMAEGDSVEHHQSVLQQIVSLVSVLSGYKFWQSVAQLESNGWMSSYVFEEITNDHFMDIIEDINSEQRVMH